MSSSEVSSIGTATRVRRLCGNAAAELQRRQQRRAKTSRDDMVDERDRHVDRRNQPQNAEQQQPSQTPRRLNAATDSGMASRPAATTAPALT